MKKPTLIADLYERCKPGGKVSRGYDPDKWLAYDYATAQFAGTCLLCMPYQEVPELEIPIDAKGWCRIYLGTHYGMAAFSHESRMQIADRCPPPFILRARLFGEKWRDMIEPEHPYRRHPDYFVPEDGTPGFAPADWHHVTEVFWRTAELDGKNLLIYPQREVNHEWAGAALAYVRLEHAEDGERGQEKPRPDTRTMIGIYDGSHPPLCEAEARKWLEPLRDSDFETVAWSASYADQCFYPSKVGHRVSDP